MKNNTKNILLSSLLLACVNLSASALTFTTAYDLALLNASNIKSSSYLAEADKEKITQEESQLYPQINFSGGFKTSNYQYHKDFSTANKSIQQNQFNASLSLKQSIYTPEVYSRIDLQESRSKYSEVKVELEKEQLAQNVFNAYLDVLKSRSKIELLTSYLTFNKTKYNKILKQFEKNLSNKMDLLEMKVEYDTAKIDLAKEQKLFESYSLKLEQFIGDAEYTLPALKKSDQPILNMIDTMQTMVAGDMNSLQITQAQVAAEISQKNIENASDAHLPTVTFNASATKYQMNKPDVTAPYDNVELAMININIPIYGGGYTSSRVASSKLEYKAALEEIKRVQKDVGVEYSYQKAIFNASVESVTLYRDSLASAALYVESVEQGYKYGLKSLIDLNEAKSRFYKVKYTYVENIYEMVNSYIALLMITHNFEGIKLLDELVKE